MKKLILILLIVLTAAPAAFAGEPAQPVVILGIDGMDPQLLQKFVDEGLMPNFKRFMEENTFTPLGTSVPPQSPVAWSNFITGMDSGGHGIFDFIHRDPETYYPLFSAAEIIEPEKTLKIGKYVIPMSKGQTLLLRKGVAFWQLFDEHDVPYVIFRVPANFPPAESEQKTLSGMGTPDLLGTYGIFSFFTDDPEREAGNVPSGEIYKVRADADDVVHAELVGPPNSMIEGAPVMKIPFSVTIDRENDAAVFAVGDERFILQPDEWSHWVELDFPILGPLKSVSGIVRFHLRSLSPHFELYATPINLDPKDPALPISTPAGYSAEVADRIGMYYTQGMPEDTQGLASGALNDAEFVGQTRNVMAERWRMLDAVLDDFNEGLLFFYVSTIDQSCHALWRNTDEHHPAHTEQLEFADRFEQLYVEMDHMLEVVQQRVPDNTILIVMSDHGFAPYYKKFHLNAWLHQNGYLNLVRPERIGQQPLFANVFWRRTQAYAVGINGMYVNLLGREGRGVVRPGEEYDRLLDEISEKLLAVRDPENGEQVITRVYKTSEIYHGPELENAPDLVIGYNRGYRGSDTSALGTVGTEVLTPNLGTWTGDHCMDHTLVPGVLLANRPLVEKDPDLKDMCTTLLNFYGIPPRPQMRGRVVLTP